MVGGGGGYTNCVRIYHRYFDVLIITGDLALYCSGPCFERSPLQSHM